MFALRQSASCWIPSSYQLPRALIRGAQQIGMDGASSPPTEGQGSHTAVLGMPNTDSRWDVMENGWQKGRAEPGDEFPLRSREMLHTSPFPTWGALQEGAEHGVGDAPQARGAVLCVRCYFGSAGVK